MNDQLPAHQAPVPADEQPRGSGRAIARRRFLQVLGGLGGLGLVGGVSYLAGRRVAPRHTTPGVARPGPGPPAGAAAGSTPDSLDRLAHSIRHGAPGPDAIPPIDRPQFVPAAQARFLAEEDVVFGLVRAGQARAYPQLVLVWHEIVNDRFPDGPLSVTYCPLTGSVLAFRGVAPDGKPYTFGTSGDLVNSNLLMYDRQTDSRWPQLLGQAILGPSRGRVLQEVPLEWTRWGRWRGAHPDTQVLSTHTGSLRSYGTDPYGSYNYGPAHELFGYYRPGLGRYLYFPLLHESDRFDEKEVMVGAKLGAQRLAVRKSVLRGQLAVNATMGRQPVVFLHDPALDVGRAFLAGPQQAPLRFAPTATPGRYTDDTGSTWDTLGHALQGRQRGTSLRRVLTVEVMWLAWYAFFPQAKVLG
ncbi:MAG TPA: DUF3179 domain-containing protein [Actinomycetota bacterium]|nr:DUF3179 domain-containing protein [Actinomycetota bacterium]